MHIHPPGCPVIGLEQYSLLSHALFAGKRIDAVDTLGARSSHEQLCLFLEHAKGVSVDAPLQCAMKRECDNACRYVKRIEMSDDERNRIFYLRHPTGMPVKFIARDPIPAPLE